ncbi:acyl carrier protein [Blastococcus tunisiensis]|uniref:Phosphopantetheine attachment site n=1 Tax=Blastococcus tunisiensis TaxID=1798228 RepID=A0A1I1XB51_9ACTN|nr:acyl carrier protein [Blastococcus sp. DSM 46838]SFE04599.1 Phosphopantetheine attachment site [Blastococcus sp. DSM 46838]
MAEDTHVRQAIVGQVTDLLIEEGKDVPTLRDDTVLLESGLDSLGFAVLVTRLEDSLGYDPFTEMTEPVYPQTLGEFVDIYARHDPRG